MKRSGWQSALALGFLAACGGSCSDFSALKQGRYAEVSPETIAEAGEDRVCEDAIVDMLRVRSRQPEKITEEQAIEGVIALGKSGSAKHSDFVLSVMLRDPSPSVRYFAHQALFRMDPDLWLARVDEARGLEQDEVVLDYISELLAEDT